MDQGHLQPLVGQDARSPLPGPGGPPCPQGRYPKCDMALCCSPLPFTIGASTVGRNRERARR